MAVAPAMRAKWALRMTEQPPRCTTAIAPRMPGPASRRQSRAFAPTVRARRPSTGRGASPVSGAATPNACSSAGTGARPVTVEARAKKRDELVAATVIAPSAAPGESIEP